MQSRALPRIHMLIGPATLTSQGRDRMDLTHYSEKLSGKPRLTGQEMLAALPEVRELAEVVVDNQNPHEMNRLEDLRRLGLYVDALMRRPDVDGVTWVQGTNSLEETAFFLNLVVRSDKPLTAVGAQRPFTAISTDAHLNLINAIRVAASPQARGKGVLAVTNSEINAARDVTKSFTYQVQTFRSRDLGVLGYVDADRIVFYRAPLRRHTLHSEFDLTQVEQMPPVEILYVHAGANAGMARAAVQLGAKGLVVAGSGAGSPGPFRDELVALSAEGIRIVRSARVGEGRVLGTGNGHEEGFIAADNLIPQKAALLLSLALTRSSDPQEIQRIFDEY
ncbi:asparaginase [Roseomonas sp. E05]|uniref:asparaginase n=1 Tax=Roseomonas sp. E05 TaxID=3046310 RepID=UPI0024B92A07|nr:asparaginase [Roseomonas sp. E05]MDJ0390462.1 asparaginase [Roseomonas sp. E05]